MIYFRRAIVSLVLIHSDLSHTEQHVGPLHSYHLVAFVDFDPKVLDCQSSII